VVQRLDFMKQGGVWTEK